MKHAIVVVLVMGLSAATAQETPELIKLRQNYGDAVERATKPLRATYLSELAKLRDGYMRGGKLPEANAVQSEIDALSPAGVAKATADSGAAAKAGKGPDLRWFVGKTWGTGRGAKWVFAKDGNKGEKFKGDQKTHTFTWTVAESGLLEVLETTVDGKTAAGPNYFRFDSRTEAWAGSDPAKLDARLNPE